MDDNIFSDELDREIVLHREAHFGGSFDVMIDYYLSAGKGVQESFDLRRIEFLKGWEEENKENLAPLLLSGSDIETVAKAKDAYKKLRDLYMKKEGVHRLIADLVLTEDEEAEEEVSAILHEGKKMVPLLIDLIRAEDFYNDLYPGYGHAPYLAAKCLGKLGDEKVIHLLFEALEEGNFSDEQMVIRALREVGPSAKQFLLRLLKREPADSLSRRAAVALSGFVGDEEIQEAALEILQREKTLKDELFASYLVLLFEKASPKMQEAFLKLKELPWSKTVRQDMSAIQRSWTQS